MAKNPPSGFSLRLEFNLNFLASPDRPLPVLSSTSCSPHPVLVASRHTRLLGSFFPQGIGFTAVSSPSHRFFSLLEKFFPPSLLCTSPCSVSSVELRHHFCRAGFPDHPLLSRWVWPMLRAALHPPSSFKALLIFLLLFGFP